MNALTIRRFIRRQKSNMICLFSQCCRQLINMRTRDAVKYVQAIVAVMLLTYLATEHLYRVSTTKERQLQKREEKVITVTKKETYAPRVPVTFPSVTVPPAQIYAAKPTLSQTSTLALKTVTTEVKIDQNVFRRNDTTPELTEKLPFLSDYKSPCWRELDELIKTEVRLNCLPYFYVVGVSQCGTKDLFERLTQHPLISHNVKPGNRWFTRLRFAGYPHLSDYLQYYHRAVEVDVKRLVNSEGYHNAIFGDFTPSTIWDNHLLHYEAKKLNMSDPPYTHADVIKHLNPNARIIVLVCDPIERLYTDYLQQAEEDASFPSVEEFHLRVEKSVNKFSNCLKNNTFLHCVYFGKPSSSYSAAGLARIEIGLYIVHLENFLKTFPRNHILVVKKERLDKDPVTIIKDIFKFLEVGDMTDQVAWEQIRSSTDLTGIRPIGDMKPETKTLLQDFYRLYNVRLVKLLGPEFAYNKNNI